MHNLRGVYAVQSRQLPCCQQERSTHADIYAIRVTEAMKRDSECHALRSGPRERRHQDVLGVSGTDIRSPTRLSATAVAGLLDCLRTAFRKLSACYLPTTRPKGENLIMDHTSLSPNTCRKKRGNTSSRWWKERHAGTFSRNCTNKMHKYTSNQSMFA